MLTFEEFIIEHTINDDEARSLLGLKVGYSPNDLKTAYYRAAKVHHPDSPTGNSKTMKQINAAYNRLKALSPDVVETPSASYDQSTAARNDPDADWKVDRERRRADLLAKQQKKK